jgi:LPXTG-motif cell wall-anchored protein
MPAPEEPAAAVLAGHHQLAAATRRTADTTTPHAATASAMGSAEVLPFTGSDTRTLLAVAGALLLAGSGLLCRASVVGGKQHRSS